MLSTVKNTRIIEWLRRSESQYDSLNYTILKLMDSEA